MKTLLITLSLLLFISLSASWIPAHSSAPLLNSISESQAETVLEFNLDGYNLEEISQNGELYHKVSYPGESSLQKQGYPELPVFPRMLAIPYTGQVSVEIVYTDSEIVNDMNIYPTQEADQLSQTRITSFQKNSDFYNSNTNYPGTIVETTTPAIFRDIRVVNVSIRPFQYNPSTQSMTVYKNVQIRVSTSGNSGENTKTRNATISRSFEPLYRANIINYDNFMDRDVTYQQPSYLIVYKGGSNAITYLQPMIDWKKEKGFEVNLVNTTDTGSTNSSIKNYIQDAYDTWENPPEFICLVGDVSGTYGIPSWTDTWSGYNGEGDHPYSQLEGDDILADAMLGRLSCENTTQLQTIVNKIIKYEKEPYIDDLDWFNHMTLVGDPSSSGQSTIDTNMYVRSIMESYSTDFTYAEEYQSNFVNHMSTNINSGTAFLNYRGYLGMSGWDNSDVDNLNNGYKLPVAIILTCGTGSFATETSRSEGFLRAGNPGTPKGGIGSVGTATWGTHTTFNNSCAGGIFDGFFSDRMYYLGGALLSGKINLYNSYPDNPGNKVDIFSFWNNLMGDPGLEAWTGTPKPITVNYSNNLSLGSNHIIVDVLDDYDQPLAGAWVTVTDADSEIISSSYTSEAGQVLLPLDENETNSIKLTVTAHTAITYQTEISLTSAANLCQVASYTVDDDMSGESSGNGNAIANPGETVELPVVLFNAGYSDANNVTATMSTSSSFITITDSEEDYGNILAGENVTSSDDFTFTVAANTPNGETIRFEINISSDAESWTDYIVLQVVSGYLNPTGITIDDADGQLDVGETSEIYFSLENIGGVDLTDISALLSSDSNAIEILDAEGSFGNIASGNTSDNSANTFQISTVSYLIKGSIIPLTLELTSSTGFSQIIYSAVQVGTVSITDPVGPDAYGYVCYDEGDTEYIDAPTYEWIEINSIGTDLNLSDSGNMGHITDIDIPFNFKFYGEDYSQITVCTNGWMSAGTSENRDYMNWPIPGPMGAQPMIAPFWDDLKTGSGDVYYHYDDSMHYLVVEWNNMVNEGSPGYTETFQVIVYDAMYYPTTTGDCPIKFQYKEFNNVDQGSSSGVPHGQFATIGIEDHTSTRGIQYSYDNEYPVTARVLEDFSAILFTGPPIPQEQPYLVLGGLLIDDDNNQLDYSETVDMFITLNNVGENDANDVNVTINCDDPFVSIVTGVSNYGTISGQTTLANPTPFVITSTGNIPDGHITSFSLVATSSTETWERFFTLVAHAPEAAIHYSTVTEDSNNNGILDPGESGNIRVYLKNTGSTILTDVQVQLTTVHENITINTDLATLTELPFNENPFVEFPVTVSENAVEGDYFNFTVDITGFNNYEAQDSFTMIVGLAVENFETGDFSLYPWAFVNPEVWTVSEESYEGNYAAQVIGSVYGNPSMSVQLNVLEDGDISFWMKNEFTSSYNTFRFYLDGSILDEIQNSTDWTMYTHNIPAGNHTFKWELNCYGGNDFAWIDYIVFPFNDNGASGTISGSVTLTGESDVEDVVISINNLETNPDEDGFYSFTMPIGSYEIMAILQGYETHLENVTIPAYSILDYNFTMLGIQPPVNLEISLENGNVDLTWDEPRTLTAINSDSEESKKDVAARNDRDLLYYKIYRNEDGGDFEFIYATMSTHFIQELTEHHLYGYAVSAMFSNSAESNLSEAVYADYSSSDNPEIPAITQLEGNYPNPFNPTTEIKFSLASSSNVSLEIFNIRGQKVRTLLAEELEAGVHTSVWNGKSDDGSATGSGVYFYRFKAGNVRDMKKMILLKQQEFFDNQKNDIF